MTQTLMNIDGYMQPLSEARPAGDDLRYADLFDQLKELRRDEDSDISYGVWAYELKKANWSELERACHEALMSKTKDLQIVAWMVESWIALHTWDGFAEGLQLIERFCAVFWDTMHPLEPDHRVSLFQWMDRTLAQVVMRCPLNEKTSRTIDVNAWRFAVHFDQLRRRHTEPMDFTGINLEEFRTVLNLNAVAFTGALLEHIEAAHACFLRITRFLDARLGEDSPAFVDMKKVFADLKTILTIEYKQKPAPIEVFPEPDISETPKEIEVSPVSVPAAQGVESQEGPMKIKSRNDAYKALEELVGLIKQIDPQGPTTSILEIATAWKDKALVDILSDIKSSSDPKYEVLRLFCHAIGK